MTITDETPLTLFEGHCLLARGRLIEIVAAAQAASDRGRAPTLVFDDETGRVVDLDLRGSSQDVVARHGARPGPGRPKLGVVPREITLLPRHWEWLAAQRRGASATLRRLVEQAMRQDADAGSAAQDRAYRVATALAGDLPAYEQAIRALFAADWDAFESSATAWPSDVRDYVLRLAREK